MCWLANNFAQLFAVIAMKLKYAQENLQTVSLLTG
jgi:hypothetical protein